MLSPSDEMSRNLTSFFSLVLGGACLFARITGCMVEQLASKKRTATVGKNLNNIWFSFRIISRGQKLGNKRICKCILFFLTRQFKTKIHGENCLDDDPDQVKKLDLKCL